jgi:hypothetical protein
MDLALMAEFQAHEVPEDTGKSTDTTLADKPWAEDCTHEQWLQ